MRAVIIVQLSVIIVQLSVGKEAEPKTINIYCYITRNIIKVIIVFVTRHYKIYSYYILQGLNLSWTALETTDYSICDIITSIY